MRYKIFLILSLFFLLLSCGKPDPQLNHLTSNEVILAFGDSLTFGTGAPVDASYPAVLANLSAHKVINAGIPGEETSAALLRINNELGKNNPALVIVCLGGNDILHKRPYAQIKENLKKIIQIILQHHAQVILLGVPKFGWSFSPPEFYHELGDELNIVVDDSTLPTILKNAEYKSDYIHPNAQGYAMLANAIFKLLQERGALQ